MHKTPSETAAKKALRRLSEGSRHLNCLARLDANAAAHLLPILVETGSKKNRNATKIFVDLKHAALFVVCAPRLALMTIHDQFRVLLSSLTP